MPRRVARVAPNCRSVAINHHCRPARSISDASLPPRCRFPATSCRFGRSGSANGHFRTGKANWHGDCLIGHAEFFAQINTRTRPVSDDLLFGVHAAALELRSRRMGMIASNIANASTPGFKAKDIDFQAALAQSGSNRNMTDMAIGSATRFRVPVQASLDGNTVELATEQTAFAENAVAYQTTLSFLNGRIGQITRALRGE
ncbi:MAG: flagellar basal-body rod protein FlgB [Sphingomonas sp. 32-62-10]|nr:MAG: flagellar basal-body rod protein FlgB [Sphingomonas sp. 12-62-6]OYX40410.1 MAG: flagellar basal-body rod protein FlgB [Sphingomonas sp. 32-62-10]OYY65920.1 MAG: flagellar basal-body rod protein FlgB [Sphingomonas sp. 28-62-11]